MTPDEGSIVIEGVDVVADSRACALAHQLHAAALRPLRRPDGRREHRVLRRPFRHRARRDRDERAARLLAASGMTPFRKRRAGQLSGGMKQKLGLTCSLIHTPKVLLLDEPTAGVDPLSRRDFWRILYGLRGEGVAIVIATSYLDEAERCTRLGLLRQGRMALLRHARGAETLMPGEIIAIATQQAREARGRRRRTRGGEGRDPDGRQRACRRRRRGAAEQANSRPRSSRAGVAYRRHRADRALDRGPVRLAPHRRRARGDKRSARRAKSESSPIV